MAKTLSFIHVFAQQQLHVVEQEAAALFARDLAGRAARHQVARLRQDPRVAQHAAAHEHAAHAGAHARDDVFGLDAVAGSEHRNRHRLRHHRHQVPVRHPAVALLRRAPMHRDRRRAGALDMPGQLRRVDLPVVPPLAHLHRDGDGHRLRHRRDDLRGVRRLAHEAAARVVLGDLRHRAAHVDVDDVGAHLLDHARRFGHPRRLAAEDLDGDGPLLFGVLGVLERAIDAAHQPLAADHLGHDEAAPTLALHQAAKRGVGHTRHGRDDKRRLQRDGSDLDRHVFWTNLKVCPYVPGNNAAATSAATAWPSAVKCTSCLKNKGVPAAVAFSNGE